MDIAVGSVKQIAQVALSIKVAVDTVQHNKEDCRKIETRVSRVSAILSQLEETGAMNEPAMSATLRDLEDALRRALKLVRACQEKSGISHLFTARSLSRQLRQVNQDISDRMLDGIFATSLQVTIRLVTHFQDGVVAHTAPPLQDAGAVESSHISGETDLIHSCVEIVIVEGSEDATVSSCKIGDFTKFSFSEMEAATNNFSEQNMIGKGSLATVYKGVLLDGREVAIKRSCGTYNLVFPVRLQHENVVRSLGYCFHGLREMVVEEYMPNGTLSEIIDGSSRQLDWPSIFRIIQGIAQGIAYLQTMCVVHSDLKPANILFGSDMNPKICGFERSKLLLEQDITEIVTEEEIVGTTGDMPPEYMMDGIISMKSDVFSFGVLLLRTISGMQRLGFDQHPILWAWELREAEGIKELCSASLSDESQIKEIERCIDIGVLCAQELPEDRPTIPNVLVMLNGKAKLPTPKKPRFVKE